MTHPLQDKSAELLVVEPQTTRRTMLIEGFKQLGFRGVRSANSLKDALQYVEAAPRVPDLIVTPLLADDPVNALHLLALTVTEERLRKTRISLILDKEQHWCLQNAFEMGLYAWHPRGEDRLSQMAQFEDLMHRGQSLHWNDCLVSATYLRSLLKQNQHFEDLVRLEKTLLQMFPQKPALVLTFAEAFVLAGKPEVALMVLSKAPSLSGRAGEEAQRLIDRAQAMTSGGLAKETFARDWEVGLCLVVDPDEAVRNLVTDTLKDIGVAEVLAFADGTSALTAIKSGKAPDLVIQEWRLPQLPGDRLVQRLRSNGFPTVPIVVYSSLVKSTDRVLLREMGVSDVIEKPQTRARLATLLMGIIEEEKRPRTDRAVELRMRKELQAHNVAAARQLYETQVAGKMPVRVERSLGAELAFHEGDMKRANELAIEALTLGGEDVMLMNLLGKIYLKLRQFEQATQFFERAQSLAPNNVERLCKLAEAHAESENDAGADAALAKAKALDADSQEVMQTEAKVMIARGDTERASAVLSRIEGTSDVVAFLNNRAVALVTEGKASEGAELYRRALDSIPRELKTLLPIIHYNLALALIKKGDGDGGRHHLAAAAKYPGHPIEAKVSSLLRRARTSLERGEPVQLQGTSKDEPVPIEETVTVPGELPVAAGMTPGLMRLHLVYVASLGLDARVQKLLVNAPSFRERKGGAAGERKTKRAS